MIPCGKKLILYTLLGFVCGCSADFKSKISGNEDTDDTTPHPEATTETNSESTSEPDPNPTPKADPPPPKADDTLADAENEVELPKISFAISQLELTESSDNTVTVFLRLSTASPTAITVNISLSDDTTAQIDQHFRLPNTTVSFAPDQLQTSFEVELLDDSLVDANKTIGLMFTPDETADIGDTASLTITIAEDDILPELFFMAPASYAGERSASPQITVGLSEPYGRAITFNYFLTGNEATEGTDFDGAGPHQATIPAGETEVTISIQINDDASAESMETLVLQLDSADNSTIGTSNSHVLSIVDDDFDDFTSHGVYSSNPIDRMVFSNTSTVTYSADEKFVYASASTSFNVLGQNDDGGYDLVQRFSNLSVVKYFESLPVEGMSNCGGSAIAETGNHLYLACSDGGVYVFDRDAASGWLTLKETYSDFGFGVNTPGLQRAVDLKLSGDNRFLYVSAEALVVFERDSDTGMLTYSRAYSDAAVGIGTTVAGVENGRELTLSPDGKNLYIGAGNNGIIVFTVDQVSGALTHLERFAASGGVLGAFPGIEGMTISADGENLYVTSATGGEGLYVFSRDATDGSLTHLQTFADYVVGSAIVVDGYNQPQKAAVSANGEYVYVTGSYDHSVNVMARDQTTGSLTFAKHYSGPGVGLGNEMEGLTHPYYIAISPVSDHVQVLTSTGAILALDPSDTTSDLTFVGEVTVSQNAGIPGMYSADVLASSADNKFLYLGSSSVVHVLRRDLTTGSHDLVQSLSHTGKGIGTEVATISGIQGLAVAPDGKNVYVSADSFGSYCLTAFTRDTTTGELSYLEAHCHSSTGLGIVNDHIGYPRELAVTHDNTQLLLVDSFSETLQIFDRNATTGALTIMQEFSDVGEGIGTPAQGLGGAWRLTISPDDKNIYVLSLTDDALVVFSRDTTTKVVSYVEVFADVGKGIGTAIQGLGDPRAVSVSPDGKNVYTTSDWDEALVSFTRNTTDGTLTWLETFSDEDKGYGTTLSPYFGSGYCLAVSADNNTVVTSRWFGNLIFFDRDPATGLLDMASVYSETGEEYWGGHPKYRGKLEYTGLAPTGLLLSPDNQYLYLSDASLQILQFHPQ